MGGLFNKRMNILGRRRLYFIVSAVLIVVCCVIVPLRGIHLGSEFTGGSSIIFKDTGDLTIGRMRSACSATALTDPVVQSTYNVYTRESGFVIRSRTADLELTSEAAARITDRCELKPGQFTVSSLGSSWRQSATLSTVLSFATIVLILLIYQVIRLGLKAALSAFVALLHTLLLVSGIYMSLGLTVTPTVVMVLFAVIGYSAYTSMLMLRRISENVDNITSHSFVTVANHMVNQMLARTLNTSLALLVPLLAVLFFAGATMSGFALMMIIGVVVSPCSTIMIAVPIFTILKQREPKYRRLLERYGEGLDEFTTAEQLGE